MTAPTATADALVAVSIKYCFSTIMPDPTQLCELRKQSISWAGLFFHISHTARTLRRRTITCSASLKSPCEEITMLAWMTLSVESERGLGKRLLLSSRKASWTSFHAGRSALLVVETMLKNNNNFN